MIKKFLNWLYACPDCKGHLRYSFYDGEIDHNVYKCDVCSKEWF